MSYIEKVTEKIKLNDILFTIEEYSKSDFSEDKSKNRFFYFDNNDYILPTRFIVKKTLQNKGLYELVNDLNVDYAERILGDFLCDMNIKFIDSNTQNPFLPIFQEIAFKLIEYQDNHIGLVDIIMDMKDKGINVIPLNDKGINGDKELEDIDPFTFFSNFNRSIKSVNRAKVLKYLKDDWQLKSKIPTFTPNIPWVQNQKAWFFSWEKDRKQNDINLLWKVFIEILNDDIQETTFNKCLEIKGVNRYLTFGLFWLNSDKYIALDDSTIKYLQKRLNTSKNFDPSKLGYEGYMSLLKEIKEKIPEKSFYEIVALKDEISTINLQEIKKESLEHVIFTYKTHGNVQDYFEIDNKPNLYPVKFIVNEAAKYQGIKKEYSIYDAKQILEKNFEGRIMFKSVKETINIKNIILYGAPGTGKTYGFYRFITLMEQGEPLSVIFNTLKENKFYDNIDDFYKCAYYENRIKFITFHQSFGYEDFIEGFRPNEKADIVLKDGIFKTICEEAKENYEKNFYLVIDEINRGNISKIFGELITLIEESKRDDYEVTLPYSKEKFSVPSNLYIIGTMNTTDKSIALIDVALRRRFTFIKMQPNPELVVESFQDTFKKLNEQIKTDLGEEYQIGHSYFMDINTNDELDFVKEYKIKPLLEEYYYGDNDKLKDALKIIGFEEEQI